MLVERPAKQHRHDLGSGARRAAGADHVGDALAMQLAQLARPRVEAVEGQAMRGQHEGARPDGALELVGR